MLLNVFSVAILGEGVVMIQFHKMIYYDIHTHHASESSEEHVLMNFIVGVDSKKMLSNKDNVSYSVGIHPWYIKDVNKQMEDCKALISFPGVIAIGEIGLDKFTDYSLQEQWDVFKQQALLAEENGLFVIIHCVKAWNELIALKKELRPAMPWVIHGFRGNVQLAKQLIREGFFLSFGKYFQIEAVRVAWPDKLFVETDDSNMDIHSVYAAISTSLGLSIDVFGRQVAENVHKILLFPL